MSGLMNKHIVKHIGRYRWADGTTYEVYKAPQIWEMSTIVALFLRVLQGGGRTGAGPEPKISLNPKS